MGSRSLLQGIFLTQRSNPGLPHCRRILYHLSRQGSPHPSPQKKKSTATAQLDFLGGSDGKESACSAGDLGSSPGQEDPLEKGRVPHASILAWRIPQTEEPGGYSPRGRKESDTTERLTQQFLKYLSSCSSSYSGSVYFIYLWLGGAFTVAVSRGDSSLQCVGFSRHWLLLLLQHRL